MIPLSASHLKSLTALQLKKCREEELRFVAEGKKVIGDLVKNGAVIEELIIGPGADMEDWDFIPNVQVYTATGVQMKKISSMKTPPDLVGVFSFTHPVLEEVELADVSLVLDGISDPGNMGTMIRTAHWFGIRNIFLLHHCTDPYAAKVVQATMGSLAAVTLVEPEDAAFENWLYERGVTLLAADMAGEDYTGFKPVFPVALVIGSESHGVRDLWKQKAAHRLTISPADEHHHPESLNASVAAALLMSRLVS